MSRKRKVPYAKPKSEIRPGFTVSDERPSKVLAEANMRAVVRSEGQGIVLVHQDALLESDIPLSDADVDLHLKATRQIGVLDEIAALNAAAAAKAAKDQLRAKLRR